jgi:hypothetical protein
VKNTLPPLAGFDYPALAELLGQLGAISYCCHEMASR